MTSQSINPKGSVSVQVKWCNKCNSDKPLDEYWKNQLYCKDCQRAYRRDNLDAKERSGRFSWEYGLRSKFNMTAEDYYELLENQGEVCAICGKDDGARRLAVDHCHRTGRIRGLLCRKCNMAIGLLQDDSGIVLQAYSYLTE
jgi:hypothetical protein